VRLAALHPCSFIDFPGRLAAVVFTRGCNLRCPYCQNPGLIAPPWAGEIDEGEVLALLASRRGRLDGLVVTGGEPTLQPDLAPFLRRVKGLGFQVKLDTNGTQPEVLEDLFGQGLVNYVAMDLKDDPEGYRAWLGLADREPEVIRRSLALLASSNVEYELRTTVSLPRHHPERLARMALLAGGARWMLQPYRPVPGLPPDPGLRAPVEGELEALAHRLRRDPGCSCVTRSELGRGRSSRAIPGVTC
jgi:pyruvate formate lyase activating enzyme